MSRVPAAVPFAILALTLALAAVPAAQAAPQPDEVPGDFRNNQENAFGAVSMVPYLPVGGEPVAVEARFWLRDLETVRRAHDVLFAFNLKGDGAKVTLDSLATAGGTVLAPETTATVEGGRQPQAHFAPATLLAAAGNRSELELVLRGHLDASANRQLHLGAMVIAFGEGWGTLTTDDGGPAQLYGFTMVMVTGLPGGLMPFQGQGNTWGVVPFAVLAALVALAGSAAVASLHRAARAMPPPQPVKATIAKAVPLSRPLARPAAPAPSRVPADIPVFGGPDSQPAPRAAAPAVPPPRQGPLPLPKPVPPPPQRPPTTEPQMTQIPQKPNGSASSAESAAKTGPVPRPPAAAPAPAPVAAVTTTVPSKPARPPRPAPAAATRARPARPAAKPRAAAAARKASPKGKATATKAPAATVRSGRANKG